MYGGPGHCHATDSQEASLLHKLARALCVVVALSSVTIGGLPAHADSPGPVCTTIIRIDNLAFNPATVTPGHSSTATLAAQNCTAQSRQVTATWLGRFTKGTGTGIPAGCPAIDPLPLPMTFPPFGRLTSAVTYLVPASCTATNLHLTVQISGPTGVLASRNADLTIISPVP